MFRKSSALIACAAAAAYSLVMPAQAFADAPTSITCTTVDGVVYNSNGWSSASNWLNCTDGRTASVSEVGAEHRDGTGGNGISYIVTWSDNTVSFIAGQEVSDTLLGAGEVTKFTGSVVYGNLVGYNFTEYDTARDSGLSASGEGILVLQKP
ncbi:hypothetical protein GCM10009839_46780 [Catenulispora yoronensis]|uniref:Uncharacterized protein n=1 Tax=Catenulispora yoronensis TaxID=450799 RepID=A0ABP5G530_9ACTN